MNGAAEMSSALVPRVTRKASCRQLFLTEPRADRQAAARTTQQRRAVSRLD